MNAFLGKIITGVKEKLFGDKETIEQKRAERLKERQFKKYGIREESLIEDMARIPVSSRGKRIYTPYNSADWYWVFVNRKGEVLPMIFEYANDFKNGLALVELKGGKGRILDKTGALWHQDSQEVKILKRLYTAPSEFKRLATKYFKDEKFIASCLCQIENGLNAKIEAGKTGKNFYEYVSKLLQDGETVHIYLEGELKVYNQNLMDFKKGAFVFAVENNVPVVPTVLVTSKPEGIYKYFKKKPVITHFVLEPIYPDLSIQNKLDRIENMKNKAYRRMKYYLENPNVVEEEEKAEAI